MDKDILKVQATCVQYMKEYNTLRLGDEERITELLKLSFAEVGEGTFIQPPYYANRGGANVHRSRVGHITRHYGRGQFRYRRRFCRYQGYSRKCCGGR